MSDEARARMLYGSLEGLNSDVDGLCYDFHYVERISDDDENKIREQLDLLSDPLSKIIEIVARLRAGRDDE